MYFFILFLSYIDKKKAPYYFRVPKSAVCGFEPHLYNIYTKASSPYVLLAFRVIGQNGLVDHVPTRQRGLSLMAKSSSLYSCYVVIYALHNCKEGKISQSLLPHSRAYILARGLILFTVENTDRVKDAKNGYPCICKNCHPHICKAKYTSHHNDNFYSNSEENVLPSNG